MAAGVMSARRRRVSTYGTLALTIIVVGVLLFPFLWMLSTSFKGAEEIFTPVPQWIPERPTLANYSHLLEETLFTTYFRNSLLVAVGTTVLAVTVSVFFAYSLSRFRFRAQKPLLGALFVSQMFPLFLLLIPIFLIFVQLGLQDSYTGLIIAHCTFAIPFSTLMLKTYFDGLPGDLEEAAMVDGCGLLGAIFRVVLPLAAPGIAAVGLFAFILSWQELMFALTLTNSQSMRTLPVGISLMIGQREVLWGPLMAASTLVTLPVVALFLFFQRYLIAGLTAGGVKG